jgi:ERCC4-type nuclease
MAKLREPLTIIVDTREQLPYTFAAVPADRDEPGYPDTFAAVTVVATLKAGDYSLPGYESRVAVERKSKGDFFGTLGGGRKRFERELERLAGYDFAAILVEAEWSEIITRPPISSQLSMRSIVRSVLAWQQRYPRIHWHFWPDRETAEVICYRILDRYARERLGEVQG